MNMTNIVRDMDNIKTVNNKSHITNDELVKSVNKFVKSFIEDNKPMDPDFTEFLNKHIDEFI